MKIRISPFTYLFYAILLVFSHDRAVFATFSAVLIHEAAHLAVIALCGCTVVGMTVTPMGLSIQRTGITGHLQDIAIHLAGPLANFALACIWGWNFGSDSLPVSANLFFGLLNLLPIEALDGAKALTALLACRLEESACRRIGRWVSGTFLFILWLFASAELLMLDGSPSLLFFCVGLFLSSDHRESKTD